MTDNSIEITINVDYQKHLVFKIKDYTISLEELRESLGDIIPDSYVFKKIDPDGAEDFILTEDEQYVKVKEILNDGAVNFITQERIIQEKLGGNDQMLQVNQILVKGISLNDSNTTSATTGDNNNIAAAAVATTNDTTDATTNATGEEKKRSSLMNINTVLNRSKIIEYCKSLELKSAINCETFQNTDEVVEWDINNALIYPAQDGSVSYLSRTTFNSIEQNALKGGVYSWNGGVAFKSIINTSTTGNIKTDQSKNSILSTAYSYNHCMVARYVVKIRRQDIKINNQTISLLKSVSKDINQLKELLKKIEYFPTQFTFGGKIASTAYKNNCSDSEKESFGLKLQADFKASLLNSDALKANAGTDISRTKENDNTVKSDYSFEETIICGGDTTLRSEFDKFILSLESYKNCNIIEIGNLLSIWDILILQDPDLYKELKTILGVDEKTFKIEVVSNVGSKSTSQFIINGKDLNCGNGKGFNIVLLNSNGTKIDSKNFNTGSIFEFFINRSHNFSRYLEKIDNGKVILISVNGSAFDGLKDIGRRALENLGIERVDSLDSHSSFCAILKKGDKDNIVQDSSDNGPSQCTNTFIFNN